LRLCRWPHVKPSELSRGESLPLTSLEEMSRWETMGREVALSLASLALNTPLAPWQFSSCTKLVGRRVAVVMGVWLGRAGGEGAPPDAA